MKSRFVNFPKFFCFLLCTGLVAGLLLTPAAALAERSVLSGKAGPQESYAPSSPNPYLRNSLSWSLFNATASFLGMPGLVSSPLIGADGLQDEGLGFHADGTTRRAGGSDADRDFSGRRASAYIRSAQIDAMNALNRPWLYDDVMGFSRDAEGRPVRMGDEYSGRRDQGRYGSSLFGSGGSGFGTSLLQRGLSAGMGFANTSMESAILGLMGKDSPYGNGKARLNFMWYIDDKGESRFGGEGDVLWPLYDSLHTTIYTQFGARSMYGGGGEYGADRWIGNIGVGQRWFPGASMSEEGKPDSGNWMLGYNAFYDHDLSRGHQRGGVGVEAQYDWLKVASNWYLPISDWKDSKDFDGNFVQERAAQGWDFRVKGYLPFYREVAVTGSFTQWYGQNVGMFGPSKLEKDPRVWSYGLEYTPVPALTAYVNQRQSEQGRADTEFGLRFTYNFGMGAEEQFKPSRVAEMRTVHSSRHDFVDRENKIILEYRAKDKYHIEFMGRNGNVFTFRIRNGLNEYVAGQVVRVQGNNVTTLAVAQDRSLFAEALDRVGKFLVRTAHAANLSQSYTTGGNGEIRVTVTGLTNSSTLSLSAGETSQTFTAAQLGGGGGGGGGSYTFDLSALAVNTASGALSGSITVKNADNSPASGVAVTLSYRTAGGTGTATSTDISLGNTDASGEVTVIGTVTALARNIQFSADGYSTSVTKTVGTVPSGFLTGRSVSQMNWAAAGAYCASHGGKLPLINGSSSLASVGNGDAVDGFGTIAGPWLSGLPNAWYWTGTETSSPPGGAWIVNNNGYGRVGYTNDRKAASNSAACIP